MKPLETGDPISVGEGRYRLVGRLGQGGMGVVYLGRSRSGRAVAVKVVRPELSTEPGFKRRFAAEVAAARRVGGFHTAPVVDAEPEGDPAWLVTAFVPGPTLQAVLARVGALPVDTLTVLAAGLAEALEAIHRAGVIHRDLKPANIIVAEDGPRVIDFGIARALDGTALTQTGLQIGTPGFLAPEQLTSGIVTPAVDMFALGVVLAQAAGCSPFGDGPSAARHYKVVHEEPDLAAIPDELREAIAACLSKDPGARPTPTAFLGRLTVRHPAGDGWLPDEATQLLPRHDPAEQPGTADVRYGPDTPWPVPAPEVPATTPQTAATATATPDPRAGAPATPDPRTRPTRPATTATGSGSGSAGRPAGAAAPAPTATDVPGSVPVPVPASGSSAGPVSGPGADPGHGPGGADAWQAVTVPGGPDTERPAVRGGAGPRRGRRAVVGAALLAALAIGGLFLWQPWNGSSDDGAKPGAPTPTPSGSAAPTPAPFPTDPLLIRQDTAPGWPATCHGVISRRDAATDTPRRLVPGRACDVLPQWSPDRTSFAFTRTTSEGASVWTANADGSNARRIAPIAGGRVTWSPDGTRLAVLRKKDGVQQLFAVNVSDGAAQQLTAGTGPVEDPAWSPDGKRIAVCLQTEPENWQIHLVDPAAPGRAPEQVTRLPHPALDPVWSPDGSTFAYTAGTSGQGTQGDIRLVAADGADDRALVATGAHEMDPAWSVDGGWVAFVRGPYEKPVVWAIRADKTGERALTADGASEGHPSWR
ncbi:protein kinase domain-containing protein [Streptomyces antarcticus]|uniref:protein kinase domain-containing protein n=1 Tax=Streptomyces antarcticus TaxID=2996458 RepID=UPI00226E0694|nr:MULTISPECIES: protein kinase [unclassified Streptomyces]MCY0943074.1 protein kinase [Streptomyces sp. H34-AA3]MCZ4084435.1 protein kinase [Streptomyces sp. H34-S5]